MELNSKVESQQKKIIHFTSGETLEEDDTEEELAEQTHKHSSNKFPMRQTNLTWIDHSWFWANQVVLKSVQTCDFLGGKLAGLLGLSLAKYQYAIDEYDRNHKLKMEKEETLLTDTQTTGYGTTVDAKVPQTSPEKLQAAGLQNKGYRHDE